MAGIEYMSEQLSENGIHTSICQEGRKTFLRIVGGKHNSEIITVGATQEHISYPMAKEPGNLKYDYNITVTGMKYTYKKVYIMTDAEARSLAQNAAYTNDLDGYITSEQFLPYRNNYDVF